MFKKLFINARYFIAPLLILATLFGILEGGPWVWTGVFLLGVGIVIDTLYTQQTYGGGFDEDGETNANPILQNSVMYLMLPVFIALQCTLAYHQIYSGMSGMELVGATISDGIFGWYRNHLWTRTYILKDLVLVLVSLDDGLSGSVLTSVMHMCITII